MFVDRNISYMMDSYTNARKGIELAQTNQRLDALAYLRRAVQYEPPHPEVWLWLAHVSPDVNEYRNCVYQALRLDPYHMVARQMQDALSNLAAQSAYQQVYGANPTVVNPNSVAPYPATPSATPPISYYENYDSRINRISRETENRSGGCVGTCLMVLVAIIGLGVGIALAIFFGFAAI
jgi:hypothetical protein